MIYRCKGWCSLGSSFNIFSITLMKFISSFQSSFSWLKDAKTDWCAQFIYKMFIATIIINIIFPIWIFSKSILYTIYCKMFTQEFSQVSMLRKSIFHNQKSMQIYHVLLRWRTKQACVLYIRLDDPFVGNDNRGISFSGLTHKSSKSLVATDCKHVSQDL